MTTLVARVAQLRKSGAIITAPLSSGHVPRMWRNRSGGSGVI